MSADKVQFEPIFQYKNGIPLNRARRKEDEKRKKLLQNLGGILTGSSGLFQPCSNAHDFRHGPSSSYKHTRTPGRQTGFPSLHQQRKSSGGQGGQSSPHQQRQRLDGQGTQLSSRKRSERSHVPYLPLPQTPGLDGRRTWTLAYEKPASQIPPVAVSLPPAVLNSVISARSGSLNIDLYPKRPQSRSSLRVVARGLQGEGSRSHDRYQNGRPGKGSVISSVDLQHHGHRKKCPRDQDLRVHNKEVREVGGLVCTARCYHHAHKSCLYKVNFCQAASVYFPFDLYKWKKTEPKTPSTGIQDDNVLDPTTEERAVDTTVPEQNKPNFKVAARKEINEVTKSKEYDTLVYVKLRSLLPKVKKGEQVLFRSPDDGWYYLGTVLQNCQNNLYIVTDVNGHQEEIWREDIIREKDLKTNIKVGQMVLAEHPDYPLSYAPGKVMSVGQDGMSVTLYDGTETVVTTAHVSVAPAKHNKDVSDIKAMSEQWLDQIVLTRNKVGEYHLARVVGIAATPHHYKIAWQQSASSNKPADEEVEVGHLFGALTPITPIRKNDYVLAPAQADKSPCYLPAKVTKSGSTLKVVFVDKSKRDVAESACFWISSNYYMAAAANYIHYRQRTDTSTP